jgi:hypothetical protein
MLKKSKKTTFTKALSVHAIIRRRENNLLTIPSFQRGEVWSIYQKQLLIDSLLREIDIPKLYFSEYEKDGRECWDIVDGQQRVSAIVSFIKNEFSIKDDAEPVDGYEVAGKMMKQLSAEIADKITDANLDCVHLLNHTEDEVSDIFVRQNEGADLKAPEKRAGLPGNVPKIILDLSKHKLFSSKEKLIDFKDKRRDYEDVCAKVFDEFINKQISSLKPDKLRKTYMDNQKILLDDPVVKNIQKTFNFLYSAFKGKTANLKKFSIRRLSYLANEMLENYNISKFASEFGDAFINFEVNRLEDNKIDEEERRNPMYSEFKNCTRGDNIAGQNYIHETLKKTILKDIPQLILLDPKRAFDDAERYVIFHNANGKCQGSKKYHWYVEDECKGTVEWGKTFHADHVDPHSNGGKTLLENGQALCSVCNQKKTSRINI